MAQEDKKLLLKDLSARLPYGDVVLQVEYNPLNSKHNNYKEGCWQIKVYEPIPLSDVIKL